MVRLDLESGAVPANQRPFMAAGAEGDGDYPAHLGEAFDR